MSFKNNGRVGFSPPLQTASVPNKPTPQQTNRPDKKNNPERV
ncbi:hypothetical protein [Neisseria polysaccharea]|nr:hypothetical protein [Neisseria polysaccharea]